MTTVERPTPVRNASADNCAINEGDAVDRIGDRSIYLEIAHYFGSNMEQSLANLDEALGRGDMETATRLAHSFKGNCATVGADSMRERCYALERLCREKHLEDARILFAEIAPGLTLLGEKLLQLQ